MTAEHPMTPGYWNMPRRQLAAAWREVDAYDFNEYGDPTGENVERLNMVEDAILQRIGAPENASGDDPVWQARIREWAEDRHDPNSPGEGFRRGGYLGDAID